MQNSSQTYQSTKKTGQDSGQEFSFFYVTGFTRENIEYPINP